MRYILDTDVISQLAKERPHPGVFAWIQAQPDENIFLSAVTLFEIRFGVQRMPAGKKRDALEKFVSLSLPGKFRDRIVPVERHVADLTARILARSSEQGWGMDSMDAIIGASAMTNDTGLATLNYKHFEKLGVKLARF